MAFFISHECHGFVQKDLKRPGSIVGLDILELDNFGIDLDLFGMIWICLEGFVKKNKWNDLDLLGMIFLQLCAMMWYFGLVFLWNFPECFGRFFFERCLEGFFFLNFLKIGRAHV